MFRLVTGYTKIGSLQFVLILWYVVWSTGCLQESRPHNDRPPCVRERPQCGGCEGAVGQPQCRDVVHDEWWRGEIQHPGTHHPPPQPHSPGCRPPTRLPHLLIPTPLCCHLLRLQSFPSDTPSTFAVSINLSHLPSLSQSIYKEGTEPTSGSTFAINRMMC